MKSTHTWGEPPPIKNDNESVWDLVIRDMQARDAFGREKYKVPLQCFNGRKALKDAYEESLDQTVYLRQALEEQNRSRDHFTMVRDFMAAMGQGIGVRPGIPDEKVIRLRLNLLNEEFSEIIASVLEVSRRRQTPSLSQDIISVDLVALADGCADLLYVLDGMCLAFGIDLRPIFKIVHEANMKKLDGPIREDGKRLKPEGWVSPEKAIAEELIRQGCDPALLEGRHQPKG